MVIRPSLILKASLDEGSYTDDTAAEIKRSYQFIAQTIVEKHATDAELGRPENTMRMIVRLHRAYWDANDEKARSLWDAVMPHWLRNQFTNLSNAMAAYNKTEASEGKPMVDYDWLDVELDQNALVTIHLGKDSSVPDEALDLVEQVRAAAAEGAFGGAAVHVTAPSRASYEAQRQAAVERAQAASAAEAADGAEGAQADEGEGAETASASAPASADAADASALPAAEAAQPGDFVIDYRTCSIEYPDGRTEERELGGRAACAA